MISVTCRSSAQIRAKGAPRAAGVTYGSLEVVEVELELEPEVELEEAGADRVTVSLPRDIGEGMLVEMEKLAERVLI